MNKASKKIHFHEIVKAGNAQGLAKVMLMLMAGRVVPNKKCMKKTVAGLSNTQSSKTSPSLCSTGWGGGMSRPLHARECLPLLQPQLRARPVPTATAAPPRLAPQPAMGRRPRPMPAAADPSILRRLAMELAYVPRYSIQGSTVARCRAQPVA